MDKPVGRQPKQSLVDFGGAETASAGVPRNAKLDPNKKLILVAGLALICFFILGLAPQARAQDVITLASINSALRGAPQAVASEAPSPPPTRYADDPALSALHAFVQQIGHESSNGAALAVKSNRQMDDQAFAALRAFTRRLGTTEAESIKNDPKFAADNAWDALQEFLHEGSSPQPAPATAAPKPAPKPVSPPIEAHYVGAKVCMTCHAAEAASFSHTLMGRIGKTQKGKFDCEGCHGPGSAHVKAGGGRGVGGLISFRPDDLSHTADETNAICLACHERGDRTNWHGSAHETRGLYCTNCHTIMKAVSRKNQLKTAWEPDTCFQCHKDRRAQMFRSSHMPMREGKIVCSDCHNPHGSFTEFLLRADSINDTCYKCHAEKRGPFLFEHEPVRENCDNCHDPHGTVNEYSLKLSRPRLCFECHGGGHAQVNGPNSVFTMGRACQNCHTAIHGSNSPAGFYLQR